MIEILARAMCRAARKPNEPEAADGPAWNNYQNAARELLKAMRQPTDAMAQAGGEAVPGDDELLRSEVAKDVWRMMIEDAISWDDH